MNGENSIKVDDDRNGAEIYRDLKKVIHYIFGG